MTASTEGWLHENLVVQIRHYHHQCIKLSSVSVLIMGHIKLW